MAGERNKSLITLESLNIDLAMSPSGFLIRLLYNLRWVRLKKHFLAFRPGECQVVGVLRSLGQVAQSAQQIFSGSSQFFAQNFSHNAFEAAMLNSRYTVADQNSRFANTHQLRDALGQKSVGEFHMRISVCILPKGWCSLQLSLSTEILSQPLA